MDDKEPEFKEILDNISDGVYFVDRERRITYGIKVPSKSPDIQPAR